MTTLPNAMFPELDVAQLAADELLLVPDHLMLRDGPVTGHAVLVSGHKFHDLGPAEVLAARYPRLVPVRLPGKLLMPGMIDAHHHLTQSFGKSLAYGEPSEIFRRVWVPLESSLDDEFVFLVSKLAALESLRGGFTTVCDAGTRAKGDIGAIAAATREAGLRCVLGLICNDGGNDSSAAERAALKAQAERFLQQWSDDPLVHPSLAISVPEAASDEMLVAVSKLCADARTIFQTHVNEHLASVERSVVQRGMRPLELLAHLGALGPQVLIAHGTLVTPPELNLLRQTDTAVSYNPVASQWKGNAVAPAQMMAALGIRFGLGTDATRSDGFRLMDAAEAAQKLAFGLGIGDASCGGGWTWFDHATHAGAKAIGLGHRIGEIAVGKEADFLIVDIDTPEMCTSVDLTWDLVRLGNRDQITAVFVAGRLRLWQGWPPDWDARALQRQVSRIAHEAIARAPIQRLHPPAAEHRLLSAANSRTPQ
ncbi:5-methylthioadenosine/S-adenosylhomocysteine deaminase [Variovorax sp. SRS16]|uniref:amidohydrolase family protein n=1 Tax=Variovorax sp. SRS16 TaxID=282217 RepID=UPI001319607F|nr:amidohydrolase family protein [Variovorax sp. SRS16]VTU30500.1 5-methylthioadenosine/S-adenosylhomocysteine deaminase [Variovorax sp. SRS16]